MDLSIRDWFLVIGVLLLVAVALDGYRKAMKERRNQVRLSRNAKRLAREYAAEEKDYPAELPNGGARMVGNAAPQATIDPLNPPEIASERKAYQQRTEPVISLDDDTQETDIIFDSDSDSEDETVIEPVVAHVDDEGQGFSAFADDEEEEIDPLFVDPIAHDKQRKAEQQSKAEQLLKKTFAPKPKKEEVIQPSLFDQKTREPEKIVSVKVLAAKGELFHGEDLMHILLACDCRLGEMNIFHRYEKENEQGAIQFSIVNAVEPGVFNMSDIKNFTTPGVSFFIRLPGPEQPIDAFDCMIETAQCLVRNLDGQLRDENNSTMTQQTIEHTRQEIKDYLQHRMLVS